MNQDEFLPSHRPGDFVAAALFVGVVIGVAVGVYYVSGFVWSWLAHAIVQQGLK